MLRFFRSYQTNVIVTTLLIGVASWLYMLIESDLSFSDKYGAFMFVALSGWFANAQWLYVWFGLFLFLLAAILMIFANARLHLTDKLSYLPTLCYILLIAGVPEIHLFNPALIASILLLTGFILLAGAFESERISYRFFTAPAFISVAAFFYQYMYMYMLVVWIVIALLRPGYWREWVFSILGFALPFFFAFSWFFLLDDDYTRLGVFFEEILTIQRVMPSLSAITIIFIVTCVLLFVISFVYMLRYVGSKKVIFRNRYYVMVLIAVVTAGMIFIVPDTLPQAWYLLAFPMSFVMANYLTTIKSKRWGNIVLSLLFAGAIVAQTVFLSTN